MPSLPKRICSGCRQPVSGQCATCEAKRQSAVDSRRGSAASRGYDKHWRDASRVWRYDPEHPERLYCCDPYGRHERPVLSEMVDHIVAHKGNVELFWDRSNWRAICRACNTLKAIREEGGFGNKRSAKY